MVEDSGAECDVALLTAYVQLSVRKVRQIPPVVLDHRLALPRLLGAGPTPLSRLLRPAPSQGVWPDVAGALDQARRLLGRQHEAERFSPLYAAAISGATRLGRTTEAMALCRELGQRRIPLTNHLCSAMLAACAQEGSEGPSPVPRCHAHYRAPTDLAPPVPFQSPACWPWEPSKSCGRAAGGPTCPSAPP